MKKITNLTTPPFGHPFNLLKGNAIAFCILFFFLSAFSVHAQTIRYVKPGGTGNGSSWSNASGSISAMITASTANSGDQIWVAAGTYPLSAAIAPKSGVSMYGGFAGTETTINQRQKGVEAWDFINPTILDGQNSVKVINNAANLADPTIIDGFTITKGFTTGYGAGATIYGNMTMQNCIVSNNAITANTSSAQGAGVYMSGGTLDHCKVTGNTNIREGSGSAYGGGVQATVATAVISNCLITGNEAINKYSTGSISAAGVYLGSATMINCVVTNNSATTDGSGA